MNREIKFRAWDAEKKYFMQPEQVELYTLKGFRATRKRFTLNQYTGLKDKNGVEIYEGDVVQAIGYEWIATVNYQQGFFDPLVSVKEGYNKLNKYEPSEWQVIGNIYEHPHLLNP